MNVTAFRITDEKEIQDLISKIDNITFFYFNTIYIPVNFLRKFELEKVISSFNLGCIYEIKKDELVIYKIGTEHVKETESYKGRIIFINEEYCFDMNFGETITGGLRECVKDEIINHNIKLLGNTIDV